MIRRCAAVFELKVAFEFERIEQWLNLVAPALMRDDRRESKVRHRFNE